MCGQGRTEINKIINKKNGSKASVFFVVSELVFYKKSITMDGWKF
jgi:hypothetical protein